MPGTPLPKRPQTSKQAKRAYQKSRGIPGLSDTDSKRLERAAVLKERADRIKKREAQKAVNRQKRIEKEQKEREARKRMGIAEPEKVYVSPRQERLSQFARAGGKSKEQDVEDMMGEDAEGSEDSDQSLEDLLVNQSCLLERGSPVRPLQRKKFDRQRSQDDRRPHISALVPASTQLDDWAAFFVSNTQIQRELTDDESDTPSEELIQLPVDKGCAKPAEDETAELLRHIGTQDLELDIDEREEIRPIEETLPMFLSQDTQTSDDEQTNLDHRIQDECDDTAEAEDPTSFLLTQDLDFSVDELDDSESSQDFRARSQGTMAKLDEIRCQSADLKDAQPPVFRVDATTTAKSKTNITARAQQPRAEQPSAADQVDEEEFAFSSQDLLALENAAAVQDATDGASPSETYTEYSSDEPADVKLENYIERVMYGEEEYDKEKYMEMLPMDDILDDYDNDYGGL